MSAVSRKLTPTSRARWMVAIDSRFVAFTVELGHAMQPSPIAETSALRCPACVSPSVDHRTSALPGPLVPGIMVRSTPSWHAGREGNGLMQRNAPDLRAFRDSAVSAGLEAAGVPDAESLDDRIEVLQRLPPEELMFEVSKERPATIMYM